MSGISYGKCKNESVGGNTNEFIRFKEKLALAGVVCGIVAACPRMATLVIRQTWHSVLHVLSAIRQEQWNASGGSGTVCKT